jgi:hypothetical protein
LSRGEQLTFSHMTGSWTSRSVKHNAHSVAESISVGHIGRLLVASEVSGFTIKMVKYDAAPILSSSAGPYL